MDKEREIRLLSNEPCREDAFEGHSHQNIADQVARIIKEDACRHILGLEGGWGSGKSNLISLVNKRLNGDDVYDRDFNHQTSPFPFFVYDAWGHQADYQRRAILEELTHDLTLEKKILNKDKWTNRLEALLAKRRKTTTKEVPKLGVGLVVSILMTILTPLVVFFVGLVPENRWWLKLVISIVPYAIAIWYVIHDRRKSLKKHGQAFTVENILSELILVYKDQIKENETYTTISEKEPSSAEFKAWMDEVNADLKTSGKTLVIVFDNMDRLPSQKVESLWSSIHSFFSDKTYDHIKVIIPFDRQHVNKAFRSEDVENTHYGNDFINKTFDVVFRVPPPIMSGWQQYLADKWLEAFGEGETPGVSVTQIYDVLNKNHTPRQIIAFVNEVATVRMTLTDEVPNRYIALFVMGKEKIEKDPVGELLNPSYMGDVKFEYENDVDAIKYLSALYYQLPVDRALDVVFTQEATNALNSGDGMRLREMVEHIDLSVILGNAILKVTDVENATKALASLDGHTGYSDYVDMPEWLAKIWKDLYKKCSSLGVKWNTIKDFQSVMFAHLYDESLAEDIVSGYLSIDDDKWEPQRYVEAIDKLGANNDIISRKLSDHKRNVSPKLFVSLLSYTKSKYENYGILCDINELDTYLAGLDQDAVLALDVIPYIETPIENSFEKYQKQIQEWLGSGSTMDINTVNGLFHHLKEVSDKPIHFDEFFSDAKIYNSWNAIDDDNEEFKYDLLAMRIARRESFSSNYRTAFSNILNDFEDGDAESLAEVIEYYVSYGDLLVNSDYYKDIPIAVSVVEKLTTNSYGVSRANIMSCLTSFDKIKNDFDLDGTLLYKRLNDWIARVKFTSTKVTQLPSGLLEEAAVTDNKLTTAIHNACKAYYEGLSQADWKEHILKKDDTYRIWKLYHPAKYSANFDALKEVLKGYAVGVNATQPNKALMQEWIGICLEVKHSMLGLFNDISAILKRDSMITKEKLLFFGDDILKYAAPDKQKDFIEKLIPSEIVDADVVAFVAVHIDQLKNCDVPEEFAEKLRHLATTSLKDNEAIGTVCRELGVQLETNIE